MKQDASFPPSQDEIHPLEHPSRAQQWAGIIVALIITIGVLTVILLVAWLTRNILYIGGLIAGFSALLARIWHPIGQFLYKRKEDYVLDALKIQYGRGHPFHPPHLPQTPTLSGDILPSKELPQSEQAEEMQES